MTLQFFKIKTLKYLINQYKISFYEKKKLYFEVNQANALFSG